MVTAGIKDRLLEYLDFWHTHLKVFLKADLDNDCTLSALEIEIVHLEDSTIFYDDDGDDAVSLKEVLKHIDQTSPFKPRFFIGSERFAEKLQQAPLYYRGEAVNLSRKIYENYALLDHYHRLDDVVARVSFGLGNFSLDRFCGDMEDLVDIGFTQEKALALSLDFYLNPKWDFFNTHNLIYAATRFHQIGFSAERSLKMATKTDEQITGELNRILIDNLSLMDLTEIAYLVNAGFSKKLLAGWADLFVPDNLAYFASFLKFIKKSHWNGLEADYFLRRVLQSGHSLNEVLILLGYNLFDDKNYSPEEVFTLLDFGAKTCNIEYFGRYSLKILDAAYHQKGDKPAFVFFAKGDHNNSFYYKTYIVEDLIAHGYRITLREASAADQVYSGIKTGDISSPFQLLFGVGHADSDGISLNNLGFLLGNDSDLDIFDTELAPLRGYFTRTAQAVFASCSAAKGGKGAHNIANHILNMLDIGEVFGQEEDGSFYQIDFDDQDRVSSLESATKIALLKRD